MPPLSPAERIERNALIMKGLQRWAAKQEQRRLQAAADMAIAWSSWGQFSSKEVENASGALPAPWWKPGGFREEVTR